MAMSVIGQKKMGDPMTFPSMAKGLGNNKIIA